MTHVRMLGAHVGINVPRNFKVLKQDRQVSVSVPLFLFATFTLRFVLFMFLVLELCQKEAVLPFCAMIGITWSKFTQINVI